MDVVHFTSAKNLRRINKKGYLEPRSKLYEKSDIEQGLAVMPASKYLVCIPADRLDDWQRHPELWGCLQHHTKGEVKLYFSLQSLEGVFVREHGYLTNEYARTAYNTVLPGFGDMGLVEWQRRELMQQYVMSTKPLETASLDDISAPELWIPYKVSSNSLRAEIVRPEESLLHKIACIINPSLELEPALK